MKNWREKIHEYIELTGQTESYVLLEEKTFGIKKINKLIDQCLAENKAITWTRCIIDGQFIGMDYILQPVDIFSKLFDNFFEEAVKYGALGPFKSIVDKDLQCQLYREFYFDDWLKKTGRKWELRNKRKSKIWLNKSLFKEFLKCQTNKEKNAFSEESNRQQKETASWLNNESNESLLNARSVINERPNLATNGKQIKDEVSKKMSFKLKNTRLTTQKEIVKLFRKLKEEPFINCTVTQFKSLFGLSLLKTPIIWLSGNASELLYFYFKLEETNIIEKPTKKHQILRHCFIKPKNIHFKENFRQLYTGIKNGYQEPKRAKELDNCFTSLFTLEK